MICSFTQVLSLILIIVGAVAEQNTESRSNGSPSDDSKARGAAGWLVFCAIVVLFYELSLLLLRFINVEVVNRNITILIIVVSI